MKKISFITESAHDPKGFQRLTVHDERIPMDLKKQFWESKKIKDWSNNIELYYKKSGTPEVYLFGCFTWVIHKDLIKAFEKKIGKEKLYNEVEFLPVKIVPKTKEVEKVKCDGYYLVHVLNEIDLHKAQEDIKNYNKNDGLGFFYKKEIIGNLDFFKTKSGNRIRHTNIISDVIKSFNIKIIDEIKEVYLR